MAGPAFNTPARTAALAGIVAAWSVVTAVPIFASVLLQPVPVDHPSPCHEARTVAVQSHIVDQWRVTWAAQARPKLMQPGAVVANPVLKRPSLQQIFASHYADRGFVTVWGSALVQPVPVDAPPFLHPGRAVDVQAAAVAAWTPALSPTIRQIKFTPAGSAPTADTILSVRQVLALASESVTWPAQARPKLAASILAVPVNDPPSLQQERAIDQLPTTGLWPMLSWEAQTARKLPQAGTVAGPSQPSTFIAQAPIDRWEPLAWPAQRRPSLPSRLLDVPVNEPPYTSRNPQRDSILAAWIPPPSMPPRSGPVPQPFIAVAPDDPHFSHQGRSVQQQTILASWDPILWPAQRAPLFPQGSMISADNPPVAHHSRSVQLRAIIATWEPALPPFSRAQGFTPIPPPVVNDPPGHRHRRAQDSILEQWVPPMPYQFRPVLAVQEAPAPDLAATISIIVYVMPTLAVDAFCSQVIDIDVDV